MPKFFAADGTRIHFTDEGEGLPVLCLSGLTRNGTDFDYLAPYLTGIRHIRMDYRGRGQSDWADPASYAVPVEAGDALALLDHLGIDKAAIIGTSRGGIIAMFLALTAKDRLRGACLVDVGPVLNTEGLDTIKGYIGKNPVTKNLHDLARARARMLHGFANVPDSRWLEEAQKHYIETPDGITINYDPQLAQVFNAANTGGDAWPMFDAMSGLPIALVRAANSDLLTRETAHQMQTRRPDMIFVDVADRGHVPFLDEPEAVAAIQSWLDLVRKA